MLEEPDLKIDGWKKQVIKVLIHPFLSSLSKINCVVGCK